MSGAVLLALPPDSVCCDAQAELRVRDHVAIHRSDRSLQCSLVGASITQIIGALVIKKIIDYQGLVANLRLIAPRTFRHSSSDHTSAH